jgi:hypothetical protein
MQCILIFKGFFVKFLEIFKISRKCYYILQLFAEGIK